MPNNFYPFSLHANMMGMPYGLPYQTAKWRLCCLEAPGRLCIKYETGKSWKLIGSFGTDSMQNTN